MYTSDTDYDKNLMKHAMGELFFAAFLVFFGAVYEAFSFGVFSFFMIYAFAIPLAVSLILLLAYVKHKSFNDLFLRLIHPASLTAALGFVATGVVEIYGSENRLLIVYPILAGMLFLAAFVSLFIRKKEHPVSTEAGM